MTSPLQPGENVACFLTLESRTRDVRPGTLALESLENARDACFRMMRFQTGRSTPSQFATRATVLLMMKVRTMDTMMLTMPADLAPPAPASGLELTLEEGLMLQALWLHAERVDWAVYDRLRMRVMAWSPPVSAARDGRKE